MSYVESYTDVTYVHTPLPSPVPSYKQKYLQGRLQGAFHTFDSVCLRI